MKLNTPVRRPKVRTHEGAPAFPHLSAEQSLRRSVMACLLWEDQFYEDGESIADRIRDAARQVSPSMLAMIAVEAREEQNLRHVPLLLLSVLAQTGAGSSLVSRAIERCIQRADELTELLVVHAKLNGVTPDKLKNKISAQMKKGLGRAFRKFDAYQLAKYDRDGAVKLRDALFLCHARPKDAEQEALWRRLVAGELESPDTWEVGLSAGADKAETFTRLLRDRKLGYLALLRNLRNMTEAGVDDNLIRDAITARAGGAHRVLPFRYVAAARACPRFEPELDQALQGAINEMPTFSGRTVVLVDVSGSMNDRLSRKSDMTRMDAAATLASIIPGELRVFSFSDGGRYGYLFGGGSLRGHANGKVLVEVPPRRGMAGVDAVIRSQAHGGTELGRAVSEANAIPHDRLIVITDEQSADQVPNPVCPRAYMINVASYKNGVGYGRWVHIDGWSESVLRYIRAYEEAETEVQYTSDPSLWD